MKYCGSLPLKYRSIAITLLASILLTERPSWADAEKVCAQQPEADQEPCQDALHLLLNNDSRMPNLTIGLFAARHGWTYEYRLPGSPAGSAPQLRCPLSGPMVLPRDRTVSLLITSEDTIHKWAIPAIGIRGDAIPGRLETVTFNASKSGTFSGGKTAVSDDPGMGIELQVLEPDAYLVWERDILRKKCAPGSE